MRAGVSSLAGICGLYAEVTSGSSGAAPALCATLALLSGLVAAMFRVAILSERTAWPDPDDDDGGGAAQGSVPPSSPDDGAELRWRSFERDFREYAGRRAPAARAVTLSSLNSPRN